MKDITLVAIDFVYHDLTRCAIEHTLKNIDVKEIVVISDKEIVPGTVITPAMPYNDLAEYMLKGFANHVNTEHALFVQWDGIANDKNLWQDEFLKYDYIGAVWPWEPEGRNVGNGGFSLRSKRLLDACMDTHIQPPVDRTWAEDKAIGNDHRPYLEQVHNIKYAPKSLARQFSFELGEHVPSFGFHGLWNVFNFMSDNDMEYFYPRINYKGWNLYKWHHTLAAVIRRERMDIYEYMLNQLIEHSPELLAPVAHWLDGDAKNPSKNLVIN